MSEEPEKPKVVNLFGRTPFDEDEWRLPMSETDMNSLDALQGAYERMKRNEVVGLCIIGQDPTTHEPRFWVSLPPGAPRTAVLAQYIGFAEYLKLLLAKVMTGDLAYVPGEVSDVALEDEEDDEDGEPEE